MTILGSEQPISTLWWHDSLRLTQRSTVVGYLWRVGLVVVSTWASTTSALTTSAIPNGRRVPREAGISSVDHGQLQRTPQP